MRFILVAMLSAVSVPAWAGPITASHTGCVSSFNNASQTATWESSRHFRWVVLWQDDAGCDATTGAAIGLNGVFERVVMADGSERVVVNQSLLPTCGRGQMDAQDTGAFTDEMLEILAVVFNTGVDCERREARPSSARGPFPETIGLPVNDPPTHNPPNSPPSDPPDGPVITPFGVPVPDGGSALWMLVLGVLALAVIRSESKTPAARD